MNVFGVSTDGRANWKKPFPERSGFKFRLLGGDVYDPDIKGGLPRYGTEGQARNWFNTIPRKVRRWRCRIPVLPFLAVQLGSFGFYVGWKVYGFDRWEYLDYPGVTASMVADGAMAMCLSMRFSRSL